ncbi:hypothetical protein B0187_01360 [Haemophilus paracuniculus]|uniref:Leucine-rich repeat domain-containing protein n=1 Tax=Haemophilus paracuniculus TaxID=734 RepID=A0A1T0AUN9_9PAST|nr:hypothetical protein [Haemophilus paracuniculus]OOS00580.1 hypothetical protein B0187_01360 [Haemophilus paracuniculus]
MSNLEKIESADDVLAWWNGLPKKWKDLLIKGIERDPNFESLVEIYQHNKEIPDVSILYELKNLKKFYLSCAGVSDISFLSSLENLERLLLESNNISDISVLSKLKN